jgi:hypothetical protein
VGGEDVEDQAGAVEHLHLERIFEVARLPWCQLVVEDHQVILQLVAQRGDLLDLAWADEVLGERLLEPLVGATDDIEAGGVGQQRQLLERVGGLPRAAPAGQLGADQEGALARRRSRVQPLAIGGRLKGGLSVYDITPS